MKKVISILVIMILMCVSYLPVMADDADLSTYIGQGKEISYRMVACYFDDKGVLKSDGYINNLSGYAVKNVTSLTFKLYDGDVLLAQQQIPSNYLTNMRIGPGRYARFELSWTTVKMKNFTSLRVDISMNCELEKLNLSVDKIKVFYNYGQEIVFDVEPAVIDGRTLIPARAVFEKMGAVIGWDSETRVITVKRENTEVKLQIDSNKAYINGQETLLDVPAQLIDGRTLVPLRFIAEAFKAQVYWGGAARIVHIVEIPGLVERKLQANVENLIIDGLSLQKSSEHFLFYSVDADRSCLEDLSKTLESNFTRICNDLKVIPKEKILVKIYSDTDTYHKAIGMPDAEAWQVGNGGIGELKMVSPLNPGTVHTYDSLMKTVIHEFTHTLTWEINPNMGSTPKWLSEGLASYEANQVPSSSNIKSMVANNSLPTFEKLETSSSSVFGSISGYAVSYTIVEFIIKKFGMAKISELIKTPTSFKEVLGIDKAELEKQWISYVKDTYK